MARRPGNPPASPASATLRPPKRADSRTHGVPANRALGAGIAARETAILHPVGSDGPIQPTKAPHTEFLTLPRGLIVGAPHAEPVPLIPTPLICGRRMRRPYIGPLAPVIPTPLVRVYPFQCGLKDGVGMNHSGRGMASAAPADAPQTRGIVGAPHAEPVPADPDAAGSRTRHALSEQVSSRVDACPGRIQHHRSARVPSNPV